MAFSTYACTKYISATSAFGPVGLYCCSSPIARLAETRERCRSRSTSVRKAFCGWIARWSTCQRSMYESPLFHSSANRPLSRNSPSELPLPPAVALFSRPSAPRRTAFAPAADCTSLGLMMSGSWTCSTSVELHAASARVAARVSDATIHERRARCRRGPAVMYEVIREVILEAEGETDRVVARGREGLELRRCVASSGCTEGFGVHARVLRPQDAQVPRRQGGGDAAAVEVALGPLLGCREGEVQLAEPDEVTILDEARLRLDGGLAHEHRPRLLEQRRVGIDQARAVEAARTADAFRVVVGLEAALVIDLCADANPPLPEVESVVERELVARQRIAQVVRERVVLDLAERDDAVVVGVAVAEQRPHPPAVDGIPFLLALGRAAEAGQATEADDLVLVRRAVQRDVPAEHLALEELRRDERLPALVAHLAEILEARGRTGAERGRQAAADERVLRRLVVVRDLGGETAVPERAIHAELQLGPALRLQVAVAEGRQHQRGEIAALGPRRRRGVVGQGVRGAGL